MTIFPEQLTQGTTSGQPWAKPQGAPYSLREGCANDSAHGSWISVGAEQSQSPCYLDGFLEAFAEVSAGK